MPRNRPSTLLLGFASGMSPFAMALVVPTLELFSQQYDAPYSKIQFIISAYLFGLALAQPIVGFLSDRVGRRPVMIYGIILFLIASFICLKAETLTTLILARFMQGIGASVGTVMSRAIIRDTTTDNDSAKPLSRVVAIMGMAPMIAPVVGVLALEFFGDPSGIFIVTLLLGILIIFPVIFLLPETLDKNLQKSRTEPLWHQKYAVLLKSKVFIGSTMVYGFTTGSFFALLPLPQQFFLTI